MSLQVYLQSALLYTTTSGSRVVRISTLALPVSDQMGPVFKGADLDSQLAAITRQVRAELGQLRSLAHCTYGASAALNARNVTGQQCSCCLQ